MNIQSTQEVRLFYGTNRENQEDGNEKSNFSHAIHVNRSYPALTYSITQRIPLELL